MNGYDLSDHFRELRPSFRFSSIEADLFYELVAICNKLRWPTEFQYSNPLLCATLGVSEKSLISARNRLKQAGLLDFTSGHKRNPTIYRLIDPDASAIPLPEVSKNGSTSDSISGSINGSKSGTSINKEKTKRKTKPQPPAAAGAGEGASFEDFWELFGKKEDRHKCEQRWKALSPADQAAALAAVPAYVAAKPDRKYRKNPLTWLNGRCWLDEVSNQAERPAPVISPAARPDFDPEALFYPSLQPAESEPLSHVA
ncbi:hypothetical protein Q5H93_21555 [Hymenobacter sp. ASUV-10]|uniref:Helix-turn-helix domain-containing protein n=1 Tax=Hymenobacter aranciens TaxID=3063996 RepID=A0ABT9BL09_9BACT|nr:hypothetical protein [Hymenobacter sp. ASUV-10]MDO7877346.1 hypothetical protein [Hymenobacter sp. ASUV-10]